MSRYKVIQDIEAEDKLLGPLTLRQFVFAGVAVMFYYFCYLLLIKHIALFMIIFLPPALFATFFAIPFGRDQPTEIWALAKLRFLFKPRRRIWDQSGVKDLVTINAPKRIEEVRTNGLSQTEVRSRLSALANTIDSRGWAVKNVNLNLSALSADMIAAAAASDRLVDAAGLPQEVPQTDVQAADDILDEQNNPIAQQFEQMIAASTQAHRQQILAMMSRSAPASPTEPSPVATAPANYWFVNQSGHNAGSAVSGVAPSQPSAVGVPAAEPTADEALFARQLKAQQDSAGKSTMRLKTIQPLGSVPAQSAVATSTLPADDQTVVPPTAAKAVTAEPNPAILELAKNNDFNVATLARQAQKNNAELLDEDDGEVVIALR